MSSGDTRPPLFDPEPTGRSSSGASNQATGGFTRNRKQRSARRPKPPGGDPGTDSPKWVRPFILGGLLLVAVVSLASIFGGDDAQPDTDTASAAQSQDAGGTDLSTAAGDPAEDITPSGAPLAAVDVNAEDDSEAVVQTPEGPAAGGADPAGTAGSVTRIEAFAVAFAFDYLNFQADQAEVREGRLAAYLAPGLDPQLGWDGEGAQAAVLTMPVQTTLTDRGATVVVASQVTGPAASQWIHLSVPIAEDSTGALAVTAAPAYVPRPAAGEPEPPEVTADDAASEAASDLMEPFFTAFSNRTLVNEDGITAPDAQIRGLDGDVSLVSVGPVRVFEGDDTVREARVNVTWLRETAGSEITQAYVLTLVAEGDEWLVQQISTG